VSERGRQRKFEGLVPLPDDSKKAELKFGESGKLLSPGLERRRQRKNPAGVSECDAATCLVQRFDGLNHIRLLRRVCMTRCG
jgi:hypothetical protein